MLEDENKVFLRGHIVGQPAFSHESHEKRFFGAVLRTERLSGAEDKINVFFTEEAASRLSDGMFVELLGKLRSYNNKSGVGNKLVISVLAQSVEETTEPSENKVSIHGTICTVPIYRKTPLGREICDLLVAVNRKYGRADYLPCITWGQTAKKCSGATVGNRVAISGRLQSREYIKQTESGQSSKTAYEISVSGVEFLP